MMKRIPRSPLRDALRQSLPGIIALIFIVQIFLPVAPSRAALRKVKVGETMPEFSLPDSNAGTFNYKHGRDVVLILAFLPTSQRRIERAITDIGKVIESLDGNIEQLDVACVISGPAAKDFSMPRKLSSKITFPVLLDGSFQLWGRLGVIAAPTVIIVGKDKTIQWIKSGYGYDFVPVVRAHLMQALGIARENAVEDAQQVKTVTNDTVAARIQRHLQMAKILEGKGRIESAIAEYQNAAKLDPNSNTAIFELGELLCRTGRNKEALNLTEKLNTTNPSDKARLLLISGWARRQTGELDTAEKCLLEAVTLNPESIRALFELGKIYQARKQTEKAMKLYYKALTLHFNESERTKISEQ